MSLLIRLPIVHPSPGQLQVYERPNENAMAKLNQDLAPQK